MRWLLRPHSYWNTLEDTHGHWLVVNVFSPLPCLWSFNTQNDGTSKWLEFVKTFRTCSFSKIVSSSLQVLHSSFASSLWEEHRPYILYTLFWEEQMSCILCILPLRGAEVLPPLQPPFERSTGLASSAPSHWDEQRSYILCTLPLRGAEVLHPLHPPFERSRGLASSAPSLWEEQRSCILCTFLWEEQRSCLLCTLPLRGAEVLHPLHPPFERSRGLASSAPSLWEEQRSCLLCTFPLRGAEVLHPLHPPYERSRGLASPTLWKVQRLFILYTLPLRGTEKCNSEDEFMIYL